MMELEQMNPRNPRPEKITFFSLFYPIFDSDESKEKMYRAVIFHPNDEAEELAKSLVELKQEEPTRERKEKIHQLMMKLSGVGIEHMINFFFELLMLEIPEVQKLLDDYRVEITIKPVDPIQEKIDKIEKEITKDLAKGVEKIEQSINTLGKQEKRQATKED